MVYFYILLMSNSVLNPSQTILALSVSDFTIQLFNFKDLSHYGILRGHNSQITDICYGDDIELYSSSLYK